MRSPAIAAILLGFASSPVFAEATVEELTERVEKLERTVETLVGGMSFFNDDLKLRAAVPGEPDHDAGAEGEVVINVKADGSVQIGDKQHTLVELNAELAKIAKQDEDRPVRIRADAAVEYQRVVEVVEACQKAGLQGVSFATKQPFQEAGHEACEDKLVVAAELVPDLKSGFFETVETSRQPWIVESADGSLEDTLDGNIHADDLVLIERTSNCVSSHQGDHAMEHCDAVKTEDGVEFELSGGFPAHMSSLSVTVDAKRQFVCKFKAAYPSPDAAVQWKVTKKAMKLKAAPGEPGSRLRGWLSVEFDGEPGSRLRGWLSVEFDEIDDATGEAKSYKIEGYFKPVIQSPASEMEEDK